MRSYVRRCNVDGAYPVSFDVDYTVLDLQDSFYHKEAIAGYDNSLPLEETRRDDDVCNPCFIFHREKDKTFGCAGTLASNDTASNLDESVVSAT